MTIDQLGLPHGLTQDADGFLALTIDHFPVPEGIEPRAGSLLVRLPPGFPDAAPDMFWFDPPLAQAGVGAIPGADQIWSDPSGRTWQRWSRHIQGQWRPGVDNLGTYLAYVRRCLDLASGRAA